MCGGDATGEAVIGGEIDGAAFTGSTAVGRAIYAQLASGP